MQPPYDVPKRRKSHPEIKESEQKLDDFMYECNPRAENVSPPYDEDYGTAVCRVALDNDYGNRYLTRKDYVDGVIVDNPLKKDDPNLERSVDDALRKHSDPSRKDECMLSKDPSSEKEHWGAPEKGSEAYNMSKLRCRLSFLFHESLKNYNIYQVTCGSILLQLNGCPPLLDFYMSHLAKLFKDTKNEKGDYRHLYVTYICDQINGSNSEIYLTHAKNVINAYPEYLDIYDNLKKMW